MKKEFFITFFCILLVLFFAGCTSDGTYRKVAAIPTIPGADYVGDETCMECHDEMNGGFAKTIHGRIANFELIGSKKGCESCHGPGSLHAESEEPVEIISFSRISKGEAAAICLKCHNSGSLMDWQGGEHAMNDVACTDCHQAHSQKTKLLSKSQPELCYDCHQRIKAKTFYPSHHPIKEGKMVCSDCHQAHGSFVKSLKTEERLNDLCLNCHASKQGPFIFEHEPVEESCTICHDAHGTVANNLLVQNEPFLCLQCHQFHFHPGKCSEEGTVVDAYGRSLDSCREGMTMAYTTKCSQCHSAIHGSDLPSQSVPAQGKALTR